jgi:hypothetical protein
MAKIYKTNGEIVDIEPKNGKDFQLKELNDIVGGYIELVTLTNDEFMVVNEEGKIMGLPVNANATEIYHREVGRWDYIVGDCLICKTSQIR